MKSFSYRSATRLAAAKRELPHAQHIARRHGLTLRAVSEGIYTLQGPGWNLNIHPATRFLCDSRLTDAKAPRIQTPNPWSMLAVVLAVAEHYGVMIDSETDRLLDMHRDMLRKMTPKDDSERKRLEADIKQRLNAERLPELRNRPVEFTDDQIAKIRKKVRCAMGME